MSPRGRRRKHKCNGASSPHSDKEEGSVGSGGVDRAVLDLSRAVLDPSRAVLDLSRAAWAMQVKGRPPSGAVLDLRVVLG
eukprot:8499642-Pyramimonas_sp.AAC.1